MFAFSRLRNCATAILQQQGRRWQRSVFPRHSRTHMVCPPMDSVRVEESACRSGCIHCRPCPREFGACTQAQATDAVYLPPAAESKADWMKQRPTGGEAVGWSTAERGTHIRTAVTRAAVRQARQDSAPEALVSDVVH